MLIQINNLIQVNKKSHIGCLFVADLDNEFVHHTASNYSLEI